MKFAMLKKQKEIKPPFINDIENVVNWITPILVTLKTATETVCGILITDRIIATTRGIDDPEVRITMTDGTHQAGILVDHKPDMYLSFYVMKNIVPWHKIPSRNDTVRTDTFLFSITPSRRVIPLEVMNPDKSKTKECFEETNNVELDISHIEDTSIIVDRFGYLVGTGIGSSFGELVMQTMTLKTSI